MLARPIFTLARVAPTAWMNRPKRCFWAAKTVSTASAFSTSPHWPWPRARQRRTGPLPQMNLGDETVLLHMRLVRLGAIGRVAQTELAVCACREPPADARVMRRGVRRRKAPDEPMRAVDRDMLVSEHGNGDLTLPFSPSFAGRALTRFNVHRASRSFAPAFWAWSSTLGNAPFLDRFLLVLGVTRTRRGGNRRIHDLARHGEKALALRMRVEAREQRVDPPTLASCSRNSQTVLASGMA